MSDHFGRLLGLSGAPAVRPRLPGLFEPDEPDAPVVTLPANTTPPRPTPQPEAQAKAEAESQSQTGAQAEAGAQARTGAQTEAGARAEDSARGEARVPAAQSPWSEDVVPSRPVRAVRPEAPRLVRCPARTAPDTAAEQVRPGAEGPTAEPARVTPIQRVRPVAPVRRIAPVTRIGHPVRPPTGLPTQHPVGAAPTQSPAAPTPSPVAAAEQHRQRRRDHVDAAPPNEPVIRVNIGRIEVTATTPPAPPARRTSKPRSPAQSLASYLAERDGGRS